MGKQTDAGGLARRGFESSPVYKRFAFFSDEIENAKMTSITSRKPNMVWPNERIISKVRQPGIEPGSIAWKATMLTFTPPTLLS